MKVKHNTKVKTEKIISVHVGACGQIELSRKSRTDRKHHSQTSLLCSVCMCVP